MPIGRPSDYSAELADRICNRLIDGESLRQICRDADMPAAGTVCRWLGEEDKKSFREQYARAREAQAETQVDEMLEIADDARNDWMERHGKEDAGWQANGENIRRSQLRIDTRKWTASKMAAKKYGDKITQEHTGSFTVIIGGKDAELL